MYIVHIYYLLDSMWSFEINSCSKVSDLFHDAKSKFFWLPSNYSLCCWLSKVQFIAPKGLNGSSKNYFRSWKNHFGVSYYHLELHAFSKVYQVTKSKKRNVLKNQVHEKKIPGFHFVFTKNILFQKRNCLISEEGLQFFMSSF